MNPVNGQAVIDATNKFAINLYAALRQKPGNLFISPWNITTALAMTYAGARGKTAEEMAETLHFNMGQNVLHSSFAELIRDLKAGEKEESYQLSTANALWAQRGSRILPAFRNLLKESYDAELAELNFADSKEATITINDWVEKKTNGKIKELLPEGLIDRLTRLVLTSAIYFKAAWHERFRKEFTNESYFMLGNGEKVKVQMMQQKESFKYTETDTIQVLEMRYADRKLSMVIILPKAVDGLADLERSLSLEDLGNLLLRLVEKDVIVFLPRFKVESQFSLSEVLQELGMKGAFSAEDADFSGITIKEPLFISAVLHKAFVEVDEVGTEAAAATAVIMTLGTGPPDDWKPPLVFRADHPFLFLIRDCSTGSVLFLGRLTNPKES